MQPWDDGSGYTMDAAPYGLLITETGGVTITLDPFVGLQQVNAVGSQSNVGPANISLSDADGKGTNIFADIMSMTDAVINTSYKSDGILSDAAYTITAGTASSASIQINADGQIMLNGTADQNVLLRPNGTGKIVCNKDLLFTDKVIDVTAGDAATIDSPTGRFRKDNSGTSFTLTNAYVTANSILLLTPANAAIDATATHWTADKGAGTVTITFNAAPTSDFNMDFLVIN